jgi:transposase-like protein
MAYQRYSPDFKKSAVEKLLGRGTRPVAAIIEELGIPSPTLYQWKMDLAKSGGMKTPSRPQDRSTAEKLKVINEYEASPPEKRGEILRRLGVHLEHVEAWTEQVHAALRVGAIGKHVQRAERAEDRRRIKELEKDLRRKDRALAETTALLVLKKKADLIWGIEETE